MRLRNCLRILNMKPRLLMAKYSFFAVVLFFYSCVKELHLPGQNATPVPVLSGIFTSLTGINKVRVTLAVAPDGNDSLRQRALPDAKVTVWKNGDTLWQGAPATDGYCALPAFSTAAQDVFSVKIAAPGYDDVWAVDTVPTPVSVWEGTYQSNVLLDEYGDPLAELSVRFSDDPSVKNYYEILFVRVNYSSLLDSSFLSYYALPYQVNNILKNEGDQEFRPLTYFFSDELFNGQEVNFSIISSSGVIAGESVKGKPWGIVESGNYALFSTTSRAWYQHRKQWTRHHYTQTIGEGISNINDAIFDDFQRLVFAPDPLPMFSNVNNGLGVVAAAHTVIIQLN